jgi:hypothetical protein
MSTVENAENKAEGLEHRAVDNDHYVGTYASKIKKTKIEPRITPVKIGMTNSRVL